VWRVISFIIPLFNHLKQTQAILASLEEILSTDIEYEIILIDDFSTDGTREWLETIKIPSIRVIYNPCNKGYAKTNNIAANSANGDILILLNNDLILLNNWLQPLLSALKNPFLNVGIVGNVQTHIGSAVIDHAGIFVTEKAKIEHIKEIPNKNSSNNVTPVFAVTAACIAMWKEDFLRVGGFDENYINGGEDVDLCLKIRQLGKSIVLAKDSIIQHHVSLSRNRQDLQNERNSRTLFHKWRKEIKKEVVGSWYKKIANNDTEELIDGNFTSDVFLKPHAISLILAENSIQQEESYWARTLDFNNIKSDNSISYSITGLQYSKKHNYFLLKEEVELNIKNLRGTRNFFICGHIVSRNLEIKECNFFIIITVNGIQEKIFPVFIKKNFNLGIINPILLDSIVNTFKVTVFWGALTEYQQDSIDIIVNNFVLDDDMIYVNS
jgi:GT2 family glycosyltransferase